MSKSAVKIALCMIVKNEAHVISRCLESVKPLIDFVYVEDTGSTDGTQQMIINWLDQANLPGKVIDVPWQNFAFNRTHALKSLREYQDIDYVLIIDADDTLQFESGFDVSRFKESMTADLFDLSVHYGAIKYQRPHICRNALEFSYRGVLHEFLQVPADKIKRSSMNGLFIKIDGGGARSLDPKKFSKDAILLEQALETETDPFMRARYTFYLAQSYRDSGQKQKAVNTYLERALLGYWQEEIYISLLQAARLSEQLEYPESEVMELYERATQALPSRVEALHGLSRYCRKVKRYEEGFQYAQLGLERQPVEGLFIEQWIYDYGLLDEYSINAYWTARYIQSRDACEKLLHQEKIPQGFRTRIEANLNFAKAKLPLSEL